ncbi:MAG: hypothetical protein HY696_02360 [Deltaproteobacteria bacterium]|nr:hypothetical protein [Deltaproteobacteria bacterium]
MNVRGTPMKVPSRLLCWVVAGVLCGCGNVSASNSAADEESDGVPATGSGTGDVPADIFTTWDTIAEVVSTSLNVGTPTDITATAKSLSQHVHCTSGGPASVSGTDENGAFSLSAEMGNCAGTNGIMAISGTYADVGNNRTFTTTFSGAIGGNGCLLTMDQLTYTFVVDLTIIAAPTAETITGFLAASCTTTGGTTTVACDFSSGVPANNPTQFKAACI